MISKYSHKQEVGDAESSSEEEEEEEEDRDEIDGNQGECTYYLVKLRLRRVEPANLNTS